MEIEKFTYTDLYSIERLQPEGWPDIVPVYSSYAKSDFSFPLKLIVDGKIVGIGTGIVHGEVAWLAHIIVHPDNRNQGIGKLITETLVQEARSRGCSTINLIATDLGEPVYRKAGFLTVTEYLFFKGLRIKEEIENGENIIPFMPEFRSQIWDLDYEISGEDRRKQLEKYLSNAFFYLEDRLLTGIFLPDFGEGLIAARTNLAGKELMKMRLTIKENAAFPADNLNAKEFLYQHDVREFKTAKRMSIGEPGKWKPEGIYNRIGGNLG